MPPQFRFIQADPDEFDDLDGFDVDYAGVFNGVTAKYTNVVEDLDSLSLKQDTAPTEAKVPERHRKRKKRSANSVKLTEETYSSSRPNKENSNRSVSAYIQQPEKEIEERRSVSAKSPSPQPNTVIQQTRKQISIPNSAHFGEETVAISDTGEKRHRKRKVKRHTAQSYKNEPTPGPLTEHVNSNVSLAEADNKIGTEVSPINAWNPYKQGKTTTANTAGFAISASPINRSIGSRGSHVEPYASSTPILPETESFYADLPIEINDAGNNSLAKSIALDLSIADGAREASVASELSLHEGLLENRANSSTKLSAHSPLSVRSTLEARSLTSNIMGPHTPRTRAESNGSVRTDNSSLPPTGHGSNPLADVADETTSLKARIKELEDAQKETLLQKIEEEKKSLLIEQSVLASKLEQERSRIADISCKIVQHSMTASIIGEVEPGEKGGEQGYADQDPVILGPTSGAMDGNQGENVLASSSIRSAIIQEVSSTQRSVIACESKHASATSTTKSSPRRNGLCLDKTAQPIKSKSLHTRKRRKHIRSPSASSSSIESSESSTSSHERYRTCRSGSRSSYRLHKRRSKSEYKYLYASIKEMEARQFELLDRIAELAKETKTVRSIGTDSMPLGASMTSSMQHSSGYTHGLFPTMTPGFGMMSLPVMPMMPMVSPMCMPPISSTPYPTTLPTTPIQGQFLPQYVTPPMSHQSAYPAFPYYNPAAQQQVPISNETAALISTVSHVMGTTSVRPSVRDTIKGIMTNYGLQN